MLIIEWETYCINNLKSYKFEALENECECSKMKVQQKKEKFSLKLILFIFIIRLQYLHQNIL
jgi:hypothetical protein